MQVLQNLTLTIVPLTLMLFVGGRNRPLLAAVQSVAMLEASQSSSGSGIGGVRGMMPGSLPDTKKIRTRIYTVKTAGIATKTRPVVSGK